MKEIILEKLSEIEKRENVKILHCVESGSRAWGFASPDSDYDVRFVYVRPKEYYLKLENYRDVIEWQLDETLDINGWDVQKALRLLHKSNPTIFEWRESPIIYKTTEEWKEIATIMDDYFMLKPMLYHYLNIAKKTVKQHFYQSNEVKLKKYFYVLRPLLACKHILEKHTVPPMSFKKLMDEYLKEDIKPYILELIDKKISMPEIVKEKPIKTLTDYFETNISQIEETLNNLPFECKAEWNKLNEVFLKLL